MGVGGVNDGKSVRDLPTTDETPGIVEAEVGMTPEQMRELQVERQEDAAADGFAMALAGSAAVTGAALTAHVALGVWGINRQRQMAADSQLQNYLKPAILFIDEAHLSLGLDTASPRPSILETAIAGGAVLVTSTTSDEAFTISGDEVLPPGPALVTSLTPITTPNVPLVGAATFVAPDHPTGDAAVTDITATDPNVGVNTTMVTPGN